MNPDSLHVDQEHFSSDSRDWYFTSYYRVPLPSSDYNERSYYLKEGVHWAWERKREKDGVERLSMGNGH